MSPQPKAPGVHVRCVEHRFQDGAVHQGDAAIGQCPHSDAHRGSGDHGLHAGTQSDAGRLTRHRGSTGTQSNLESAFYSRGFMITSMQVDGGAAFRIAGDANVAYFPQIDLAQFDHVEILRGPAGLFNGYGDPSGTVNLVRKKPLDHAQVTWEGQAGSWSNYRAVLDATAPLALDGRLRGRLVMTYQDNEYFSDLARDKKDRYLRVVVDHDLTTSTLLTGGISFARQDSVPWVRGLPRYQNGDDLGLPRSASFVLPGDQFDLDTLEVFANVEQKLGDDWTAKFTLTQNQQDSTRKIGYATNAVNPLTGVGPVLYGESERLLEASCVPLS